MEQESLTNEALLRHYPNQFKLALHAIRLAQEEIQTHASQSYIESQNVATVVLNRITEGIDAMEDAAKIQNAAKIQKTQEVVVQEKMVQGKVEAKAKVKAAA